MSTSANQVLLVTKLSSPDPELRNAAAYALQGTTIADA